MIARKLLSLALALAIVEAVGLPVRAELLKNFKADGSIETRLFGIDNEGDRDGLTDDHRSDMRTRVLVGGSFDLLDDVHARVLVSKNNRLYGQAAENANAVQTALSVENAWVKVDKVFGALDITMGRQFYGNPDDLVIYYGANNNDILSVAALDAVRVDADIMGVAKFMGIAGKTVESTAVTGTGPAPATALNRDTDIFGGEINTDKVPMVNLAAYYYTRQVKKGTVPAGPEHDTLNVAGVRASGGIKELLGLGYNAEFVQNFGRDNRDVDTPAYKGSAWLLGANVAPDLGVGLRAKAEMGKGTGDFVAISPEKRFGIIWGEHTGNAAAPSRLNGVSGPGLSNLTVWDIGVGVTPIAKLGLDANYYQFRYSDGQAVTTLANNTSAGTELDLIASWKHSDNVCFAVSVARFWEGGALKNAPGTATSPITRLGTDVKIKF